MCGPPVSGKQTVHTAFYRGASRIGPQQNATAWQHYHSHKLLRGTGGSANHSHLYTEKDVNNLTSWPTVLRKQAFFLINTSHASWHVWNSQNLLRQEHVLAYHRDITRCLKITAAGYENKIQTRQHEDLVQNHAVTLFNLQILLQELN